MLWIHNKDNAIIIVLAFYALQKYIIFYILHFLHLHFSNLADAFIKSDLKMRTTEAIKTNKRATTCKCNDNKKNVIVSTRQLYIIIHIISI